MQKGTLESCLYLVEQTLLKIDFKIIVERLQLLNQVITVFLRSIELFEDVKTEMITQSALKVHSALNNWIKKSLHFSFGASSLSTEIWLDKDAQAEIKVKVSCNPLIYLKRTAPELVCDGYNNRVNLRRGIYIYIYMLLVALTAKVLSHF